MILIIESPQPLDPVAVAHPSPGLTDVWLRRNFHTLTRDDPDGGTFTVHTAEEAQLRIREHINDEEADERFAELWGLAAEYNPATYTPPTDTLEIIRADVDFIAMETGVDL